MARYGHSGLWRPWPWSIVPDSFEVVEELNMSMNRRTALAAALALATAGRAWAQAKAGKKIVLGQSVPLTGAASEIGLAFAAGAKLYVDNFNSQKNGPGYTFELRQLDDGYVPARA